MTIDLNCAKTHAPHSQSCIRLVYWPWLIMSRAATATCSLSSTLSATSSKHTERASASCQIDFTLVLSDIPGHTIFILERLLSFLPDQDPVEPAELSRVGLFIDRTGRRGGGPVSSAPGRNVE